MPKLSAYATFLTGLATASLALVTLYVARATKGMVEDMTRARKQVYMTEFVARVIDPLIEHVRNVKRYLQNHEFEWDTWPKKERADKVLKDGDLDFFKVPIVNNPSEFLYFVPSPKVMIMETTVLWTTGFEWRRSAELQAQYKPVMQKVKLYDEQANLLPKLLGELLLKVHKCLNQLSVYKNLDAPLLPFVVCVVFNKITMTQDNFSNFLNSFTRKKYYE